MSYYEEIEFLFGEFLEKHKEELIGICEEIPDDIEGDAEDTLYQFINVYVNDRLVESIAQQDMDDNKFDKIRHHINNLVFDELLKRF
jgi:hypothetical protein